MPFFTEGDIRKRKGKIGAVDGAAPRSLQDFSMQAPGFRLRDPHRDEPAQHAFFPGEKQNLVRGGTALQKPDALRSGRVHQDAIGSPHQPLIDRQRDGVLHRVDARQAGETHGLRQRSQIGRASCRERV